MYLSPLNTFPETRYAVGGVRITGDVAKAALLWFLGKGGPKPLKLLFFLYSSSLCFASLSRHLGSTLVCFARAGTGGVGAADLWIMGCGESAVWLSRRTLRDGLMPRRGTGP